jgi:hypothetical protein
MGWCSENRGAQKMRTFATMLLLILFAISTSGCGRSGGGASEITSNPPVAKQDQSNIRMAEATAPEGKDQSSATSIVEDATYKVCGLKDDPSPYQAKGPHIELELGDEIVIDKGKPDDPLGKVIFRHLKNKQETVLPVIKCCEGQKLGATRGFKHQKDKNEAKDALHAIIISNVPREGYRPAKCEQRRVILVDYCYPTKDDDEKDGWTCGENTSNTHAGDVHAQAP